MKLESKLYRHAYRIRAVEEEIAKRYPAGKMRCPTHLSIGQEAVPAAFAECANKEDYAVSTHRGHAHYLGKGGDLKRMMAEIYGKAAGCAKGKGGSMHLIDLEVNFMGTSAIVGNSIPVGVGLGLAAQLRKTKQVSCVFLGDGAIEEGAFYESANFAALRKLPVIFICENNLYSVYTPLNIRQPEGRSIAKMVQGMGLATMTGDGCDTMASYEVLQKAFARVRAGEGPMFLEFSTYRWREHCGPHYDNDLGYRTVQEYENWKSKEPLARLEASMSAEESKMIRSTVDAEIATAFQFAEETPFPEVSEAMRGVYA